MGRNRVNDRAHTIFMFLEENLNKPYTIGDLLAATGLQDGATTRAAIRKARALAEDAGLCMPVACPANGHTYCVTDDPQAVLDPAIHLGAIATGVEVTKEVHDSFMQSRMSQLTPAERKLLHALGEMGETDRAQRRARQSVLQATIAIRREARKEASAP